MKQNLLLLLGLLPAIAFAWSTPIILAEDVVASSIFLDYTDFITHVFWCQKLGPNDEAYLAYRKVLPDGKMTPMVQIEHVHGCKEVKAEGHHNGKDVTVVFSGERLSGATNCTSHDTSGCLDVFYKDTSDGGSMWTPSRQVPRDDTKDVANRHGVSIIKIREYGFSWISYMKNVTKASYETFMLIGRASVYGPFSNEAELLAGPKFKPSITYTLVPNDIILQMSWSEYEKSDYIVYYSRLIGNRWEEPTALFRMKKGPPEVFLTTRIAIKWVLGLVVPNLNTNKWTYTWSGDHGVTWTGEIPITDYALNTASDMGATHVNINYYIAQFFLISEGNKEDFGAYCLQTRKYTKGPAPFGQIENKRAPELDNMSADYIIKLKATVIGGETGDTLYFSAHDFVPPTTELS